MKKIILFIFLFNYILIYSQENNYIVKYKAEYVLNETIAEKIKNNNDIKEITEKYIENYSKIDMSLLFNKRESLFITDDKVIDENDLYYKLALIAITENKTVYTNLTDNNKIIQVDFDGKKYIYPKELNSYKWEITNDTLTIGNYLCYKAKANVKIENSTKILVPLKDYEVVAYFCPSIPFSYGPCQFNGLPGLILSVNMNNIHIYAKEILINPKSMIPINKPNEGKQLNSEEDYTKILIETYGNLNN